MTDDELAADEAVVGNAAQGESAMEVMHDMAVNRWPAYIAEVKRLRAELEEQRAREWFPIIPDKGASPHPMRVPWSVAEKAYSTYAAQYGRSQSLQRLADRGGFGAVEMDEYHKGWRDEVSEILRLRAALAARDAALDEINRASWLNDRTAKFTIQAIVEKVRSQDAR